MAISHYSVTTNVIQFAAFNFNPALPREKQRLRPGDVSLGVLPFYHIYAMVVLLHVTTFLGVSSLFHSQEKRAQYSPLFYYYFSTQWSQFPSSTSMASSPQSTNTPSRTSISSLQWQCSSPNTPLPLARNIRLSVTAWSVQHLYRQN